MNVPFCKQFFSIALVSSMLLIVACAADPSKNKPFGWNNGTVFSSRGYDSFNAGDLTRALLQFKRAVVAAEKADVQPQAARYLFNIGRVFTELGMADSAMLVLTGAHQKLLMYGDSTTASRAAGFIAQLWCTVDLDSARRWYGRGVAGVQKTKDNQAFWLSVSALIKWKSSHEKSALAYWDQSFELYRELKQKHCMAQIRYYQASVYYYFGEFDEAARLFDEALGCSDYTNVRYDRYKMLLASATVMQCRNNGAQAILLYQRARNCLPTGIEIQPFEQAVACVKELPPL